MKLVLLTNFSLRALRALRVSPPFNLSRVGIFGLTTST
jgi:hypothetical protein